eukprot:scaffold248326_cov55-Attheya_sp.AAC.1
MDSEPCDGLSTTAICDGVLAILAATRPPKPTCQHPHWIVVTMKKPLRPKRRGGSPPPYNADNDDDDDDDDEPFIIEKIGNLKAASRINSHFTCAPKEASYAKEIDGIEEDEDEEKEFKEEKNEEDATATGSDQKSFIEAAKEIGVYRDGMKREDINKAVVRYFNALCGGMDEYFKADIFIAKRQEIEHDRKESSNMKRKRLFADNAKREGKLKDTNEKRQHKKLLTPE